MKVTIQKLKQKIHLLEMKNTFCKLQKICLKALDILLNHLLS